MTFILRFVAKQRFSLTAWVEEQYRESIEISTTTVESPSQALSDQWIQDKMTKFQLLTYQKNIGTEKPIEEIVLKEFHEFISTVFSERPIGILPTQKPYNYAIDQYFSLFHIVQLESTRLDWIPLDSTELTRLTQICT